MTKTPSLPFSWCQSGRYAFGIYYLDRLIAFYDNAADAAAAVTRLNARHAQKG